MTLPQPYDLEHIRMRPGMYIGCTNQRGVQTLVFEAIDNAIDQFLGGRSSEVRVEVDGVRVVVSDDGPGYPFDVPDESGTSSLGEQYLTTFHNSNTADNHSPHVHCMVIGCGLIALNALSVSLVISTWRNGRLWRQEYSRGRARSAPRVVDTGNGCGTRMEFVIDSEIFPGLEVDEAHLLSQLKVCSFLFPGLRIRFQDRSFFAPNGLADMVRERMMRKEACDQESPPSDCGTSTPVFFINSECDQFTLQVAASGTTASETFWEPFANGTRSIEEGTHFEVLQQVLARRVRWRPAMAAISVIMKEPRFAGPTKTHLDMPEMKDLLVKAIAPPLKDYCQQHRLGRYAIQS
jgi:DNA gyrase subunit B